MHRRLDFSEVSILAGFLAIMCMAALAVPIDNYVHRSPQPHQFRTVANLDGKRYASVWVKHEVSPRSSGVLDWSEDMFIDASVMEDTNGLDFPLYITLGDGRHAVIHSPLEKERLLHRQLIRDLATKCNLSIYGDDMKFCNWPVPGGFASQHADATSQQSYRWLNRPSRTQLLIDSLPPTEEPVEAQLLNKLLIGTRFDAQEVIAVANPMPVTYATPVVVPLASYRIAPWPKHFAQDPYFWMTYDTVNPPPTYMPLLE